MNTLPHLCNKSIVETKQIQGNRERGGYDRYEDAVLETIEIIKSKTSFNKKVEAVKNDFREEPIGEIDRNKTFEDVVNKLFHKAVNNYVRTELDLDNYPDQQ